MFLKCPICNNEMLEMHDKAGYHTLCTECSFVAGIADRDSPKIHLTQEELVEIGNRAKGTYSYFRETLAL